MMTLKLNDDDYLPIFIKGKIYKKKVKTHKIKIQNINYSKNICGS